MCNSEIGLLFHHIVVIIVMLNFEYVACFNLPIWLGTLNNAKKFARSVVYDADKFEIMQRLPHYLQKNDFYPYMIWGYKC